MPDRRPTAPRVWQTSSAASSSQRGNGRAELFPRRREFIAPLLGPGRHVVDFPPLRPVIGDHAELADHAAPHRHRRFQRDIQEGAAGVQALQEQGAGSGVGGQQPDGAVASPQGEGVVFAGGLLMRKSHLQHGCLAVAAAGAAAARPGAGRG